MMISNVDRPLLNPWVTDLQKWRRKKHQEQTKDLQCTGPYCRAVDQRKGEGPKEKVPLGKG